MHLADSICPIKAPPCGACPLREELCVPPHRERTCRVHLPTETRAKNMHTDAMEESLFPVFQAPTRPPTQLMCVGLTSTAAHAQQPSLRHIQAPQRCSGLADMHARMQHSRPCALCIAAATSAPCCASHLLFCTLPNYRGVNFVSNCHRKTKKIAYCMMALLMSQSCCIVNSISVHTSTPPATSRAPLAFAHVRLQLTQFTSRCLRAQLMAMLGRPGPR